MSTQSQKADVSEDETENARSRAMDAATSLSERGRDGSLAMLAGSTLLVRAVRSRRNRGRAAVQVLAGAALLALGLRQRRAGSVLPSSSTDVADRGGTGTSEQRADSQQHDVNPRGTAGEPDVETKADPGEGSVQFTEHQGDEPRTEPHLDEPAPEDPRLDEDESEEEEPTEVDLSEASLADEASEAAGPTPEQGQPTQTDQIEPDESPPEDSSPEGTDDEDESEHARTDQEENGDEDEDEETA